MIITKEYNELVSDLIENRLRLINESEYSNYIKDVFRYGLDGYLNDSREKLIDEAIKLKLYGPDVDGIDIK